jgi:histidinol-phosphate aminotransferase
MAGKPHPEPFMGRFFDLIHSSVREIGVYGSGVPSAPKGGEDHLRLIKLNSNESPYGPSPKAVDAMRAALEGSHCYPDDLSTELREKLSARHGVQPAQVLIANGTTSLLGVIARTLLGPGRNAVTSGCTFISYPMVTHAAGANLIEMPLKNDGYDLDAIQASMNQDTRLVLVANPNNPTGSLLGAEIVDRFVESLPPHVIVVLDEAYYDYAQYFAAQRAIEYTHSLEHVRADRNVVVLRTFSKAHGLAGVRVGYGIGPAELMSYFARVQDTFAVSSLAHSAATAALDDEAHVRHAVEKNALQREVLSVEIARLGYRVAESWANFLFVEVQQDAREFARRLRREGVLIRPLGAWGAPQAIRVTIGTAEQNQILLRALKRVSS